MQPLPATVQADDETIQALRARIQQLEDMLAAVGAGGVEPLKPQPQDEHRAGTQLTDNERTELLDWVSACQSAYSMENNPRGPFFALPGQLQENRDSLVDYVNEILEARCQQPQREPLTPSEVDQLEARWDACLHGSKIVFAARETERAHGIGSKA